MSMPLKLVRIQETQKRTTVHPNFGSDSLEIAQVKHVNPPWQLSIKNKRVKFLNNLLRLMNYVK